MTSSQKSALDQAIVESLEAWGKQGPLPSERFDDRQAAGMSVGERLQLMDELCRLAATLAPEPVEHEPIRGTRFLL